MGLKTGYAHRDMVDANGDAFQMRVLQFGAIELHDVEGLALIWNLMTRYGKPRRSTVIHMLENLLVPIVDMPDGHTYYAPAELEKAIQFVSQLGGPGFFAPGSLALKASKSTRSGWRGVRKLDPVLVREYKDLVTAAVAEKTQTLREDAYKRAKKLARKAAADAPSGNL